MLMYEGIDHPFKPNLFFFLAPFGIYGRDELEDYLNQYNLNEAEDRKFLAKYVIEYLSCILGRMSYGHIWLTVQVLEEALKN